MNILWFRDACFLIVVTVSLGFAQVDTTSILLEEVEILGQSYQKYAVGSKTQRLDSTQLHANASSSLSDILLRFSPVYIKEYGNHQLGTIAFRGTGAGHTAVLWNGLNINSPTLGLSDFGTVSAFAVDQIDLQYGASSAMYGSDALGGTVHLSSAEPTWKKGLQLSLQQELGSFGHAFSGLKLNASTGRLAFSTKVFYFTLDNDFQYTDFQGQTQTQQNAAVLNYGFIQDFSWKISPQTTLMVHAWYQENDREVQPVLSNPNSQDELADQNIRLAVDLHQDTKIGWFGAKFGYLRDHQRFNDGAPIINQQLIGSIQYEKEVGRWLSLKAGGNWRAFQAQSSGFAQDVQENRQDVYASTRIQVVDAWKLSLNLRRTFVTGFSTPWVPSLGSELRLFEDTKQSLVFTSLLGRSYRVPTLNDRFWVPGGNPDILPEDAYSAESGLVYARETKNYRLHAEINYYRMWVDDWIIWLPDGVIWSPDNIREVHIQGLELSFGFSQKIKELTLSLGGNYAFTQSRDQEKLDRLGNNVNKQLPYVPLHRFSGYLQLHYRSWSGALDVQYTGLRYETTDNIESLLTSIPAFTLFNGTLSRQIHLRDHRFALSLMVRNLLNHTYQNYIFRAMPGRNYRLGLRYYFKHKR